MKLKVIFSLGIIFLLSGNLYSQSSILVTSKYDTISDVTIVKRKSDIDQISYMEHDQFNTLTADEFIVYSDNKLSIYSKTFESTRLALKLVVLGYWKVYIGKENRFKNITFIETNDKSLVKVDFANLKQQLSSLHPKFDEFEVTLNADWEATTEYELATLVSKFNHYLLPDKYVPVKFRNQKELYIGLGVSYMASKTKLNTSSLNDQYISPTFSLLFPIGKATSAEISVIQHKYEYLFDENQLKIKGTSFPISFHLGKTSQKINPYLSVGLMPFLVNGVYNEASGISRKLGPISLGTVVGLGCMIRQNNNLIDFKFKYSRAKLELVKSDILASEKFNFSVFELSMSYFLRVN